VNGFGILVVFMFFGRFVLNFFGISLPVLKIAGGLIVAHTAWGMVTASTRITPAESDEAANCVGGGNCAVEGELGSSPLASSRRAARSRNRSAGSPPSAKARRKRPQNLAKHDAAKSAVTPAKVFGQFEITQAQGQKSKLCPARSIWRLLRNN
jgi:hypothetical protein